MTERWKSEFSTSYYKLNHPTSRTTTNTSTHPGSLKSELRKMKLKSRVYIAKVPSTVMRPYTYIRGKLWGRGGRYEPHCSLGQQKRRIRSNGERGRYCSRVHVVQRDQSNQRTTHSPPRNHPIAFGQQQWNPGETLYIHGCRFPRSAIAKGVGRFSTESQTHSQYRGQYDCDRVVWAWKRVRKKRRVRLHEPNLDELPTQRTTIDC